MVTEDRFSGKRIFPSLREPMTAAQDPPPHAPEHRTKKLDTDPVPETWFGDRLEDRPHGPGVFSLELGAGTADFRTTTVPANASSAPPGPDRLFGRSSK